MSQVNEKPSLNTAPAGSIRFNTDSAKMEIYNGDQWWQITTSGFQALLIRDELNAVTAGKSGNSQWRFTATSKSP